MRGDVARDLSDSAYDFKRVVWPVVSQWCQGGHLQPVEAVSSTEFEKQLDMMSGIDAWQIVDNVGIRGIASRVQWPPDYNGRPGFFETFTVRRSRATGAPTEWDKRANVIEDRCGFLRPALIVHAYIRPPRRQGGLNYACMVRSDDLWSLATEDMKGRAWYEKPNPTDGNIFAVFPVANLIKLGVKVKTICPALQGAQQELEFGGCL